MGISFKSKEELQKRVTPALAVKKNELIRLGFNNIDEEDIWNFLAINVFPTKKGLTLYDIVSLILKTDNNLLREYIKDKN